MEKQEYEDDTIPHEILAHRRQELIEKATNDIIKSEEKESICDRRARLMQDVEVGQNYPVNTFK
jgi:hypothetical protein